MKIPHRKERGMATLLTAVVLLIAVFLATYNMSQNVIADKQNASAAVRGFEAFQNAQAGMDEAVEYISGVGLVTIRDEVASAGFVSISTSSASVSVTQTGDSLEITSTGLSNDSVSVSRTISMRLSALPNSPTPPNVPVVSRGFANVTGNYEILNNEEPLTIWTGGAIDMDGNANTYIRQNGVDTQLSNSKTTRGPDIISNDRNLASATEEEIIQAFFNFSELTDMCISPFCWDESNGAGTSQDAFTTDIDYTKSPSVIYFRPNNQGTKDTCDLNSGTVDAVQLRASEFTTSESSPLILVVEGAAKFFMDAPFYGIVLAREVTTVAGGGPADITDANAKAINGGVVGLDCIDGPGGAGSGMIRMNKTVFDNLGGGGAAIAHVQGSWKDW